MLRPLQLTLALIKPDIVSRPHLMNDIKELILQHGFYFVRSKKLYLPRSKAEEFYKEHEGRFFHNRLVTFMSSGKINVYILAREDAISYWRKLMGPTKVLKTVHDEPNSIRGHYGLTDTRNATHGSDSVESAKKEMEFFFPEFNPDCWYLEEEKLFREGKVKFCDEKEIHVIYCNNEKKL